MYEVIDRAEKITSVALLIGTGLCNARCDHCAGIIHRTGAPRTDGMVDTDAITTILQKCHAKGARRLSISGSGEPTVSPRSVTRVLEIVDALKGAGIDYPSVHLYSNGIRIGRSETFATRHLPFWKSLGLGELYLTVHDIDPVKNAAVYGVRVYPSLATIVARAHRAGLAVRANIVLKRGAVDTREAFAVMVVALRQIGFDAICAWPIRGDDDQVDYVRAPSAVELERMAAWAAVHTARDAPVRLLLADSHAVYEAGEKLTLFPDGTLSNTWCR